MAAVAARPILELQAVSKHFGGLRAVESVSLQIPPGERRAIIGPNGAGKSTLFNVISGQLRADSGNILFNGDDLQRIAPHRLAAQGIGRTFQVTSIFQQLSVLENVQIALFAHHRESLQLFRGAKQRRVSEAMALLQGVGLEPLAAQLSGTLSHGDQKRLELAIALAREPTLLLLDEPTAGMPNRERRDAMALVERLASERAITLLFTEHDMDVVFATAQRVTVLHQGEVLAEGTPAEVREDPEVQRVYLGWKRPHS